MRFLTKIVCCYFMVFSYTFLRKITAVKVLGGGRRKFSAWAQKLTILFAVQNADNREK